MKKLTTISVCACMAIATGSFTACKKDSNNNTTPTPTTSSTTPPTPAVGSVDGVLVSLLLNVNSVTAGIPITISTGTALAVFYSTPGGSTFVDGGTVSVNGFALEKQSNNSYIKTISAGSSTSLDLDFGTNNSNWSVGGAGSVPAFTYNHNVTFPEYTGTVPDSVVRSAGVTISLTGKVSGADSVLLFMASGNNSITRTVAGTASSVSFSAADLSGWGTVSDKSAVLEVVPYKVTMSTQGGKSYAFIKEYAAVKNINIE